MSLTDAERADLNTLTTSHISDAMEWLDLPRSVIWGFRYIGAPHGKLIGPASTARQLPKAYGDEKKKELVRHVELTKGLAKKGDVVIIDVGGRTDVGTWGEMHTYRCLLNEVAGVIVNGAVRDSAMIRDSGMPTMCRDVNPIKSLWDLKTAALNEPVMMGTVCINPGDIVFGDEDGIVTFAPELTGRIIERAKEIRDNEDQQRDSQLQKLGKQ